VLVADINELKFEVGILADDSFGAPANTHLTISRPSIVECCDKTDDLWIGFRGEALADKG